MPLRGKYRPCVGCNGRGLILNASLWQTVFSDEFVSTVVRPNNLDPKEHPWTEASMRKGQCEQSVSVDELPGDLGSLIQCLAQRALGSRGSAGCQTTAARLT